MAGCLTKTAGAFLDMSGWNMKITAEELRDLLLYFPETGIFRWKKDVTIRVKAGHIAGTVNQQGYVQICIKRRYYNAHRLAWLYVYGNVPAMIDHINGIRTDNRIRNLRPATRAENARNSKVSKRNLIGLKGVSQQGDMFIARICVNRKRLVLGLFETAEEAHEAYCRASLRLHEGFSRAI